MVHTRCMLDKQGYTRASACTRSRVRALCHFVCHEEVWGSGGITPFMQNLGPRWAGVA
jgi:hypothetical protein